MRILLVRPHIGRHESGEYVVEGRMEPAQLAVIASLGPGDAEYALADDRMERIPFEAGWDLVAITVETFTAKRAYEIAADFRARGTKVVLGGIHPSLIPEEAEEHADTVVVGDAETVWESLVEDFRAGSMKKRYSGESPGPVQNKGTLRSELYKGKRYLPLGIVQYGRGCGFSCEFCGPSVVFGSAHTHRPPEDAARELAARRREGIRCFLFADDNISADREAAIALFKEIAPLKLRWGAQAGIAMARDSDLLSEARKAGCVGLVIGFESVSPEAIEAMGKPQNLRGRPADFDAYGDDIEALKDEGMAIWGAFTIGHDTDTKDTALDLCAFAERHRFAFASFNILVPYPGTSFYERLRGEGRLLFGGKWWLHPDYRLNEAAFLPARMNPLELTRSCFEADLRFNSIRSIFARSLDPRTTLRKPGLLAAYWAYNLVMRSETLKRNSLVFGKGR